MSNINFTKKRILWIEDEAFQVWGYKSLLCSLGAEVLFAKTLSEALKLLRKNDVDLIILDCMLPLGNDFCADTDPHEAGIKFVQTLRDKDILKSKEIPILVLSAVLDDNMIFQFRQLGVAAIIHKPISWESLLHEIAHAIRREDEK
jgi:CheY-like chemotaxis protein